MSNTLERLRKKAESNFGDKTRMPSIMQISKLLNEHNIEHRVDEQTNIVEHRSVGRVYVNSRREGKTGLRLVINQPYIELDTSDSYYSLNTWQYARKIVELIEKKNKMKTLKNYLTIALMLLIFSCSKKNDPNCGQWVLGYTNDNNWSRQAIICDSLEMINKKEAIIYVNNKKTHIYAEILYPMYQPCKNQNQ